MQKSISGSQSLRRGLQLIELLAKYPNGCPLVKISEESGLNKSTTYRLIRELQAGGFVIPANAQGSYKLTTKLLELGYHVMSSSNIYDIVSPELERLNMVFGETVNFSTRSDDHAILLYKLNPTSSVHKTKAIIGQYMHLYCTGMGKTYLAFENEMYVKNYWESHRGSIIKLTDTTIVSYIDFKQELEQIRQNYYAVDREENELGITCLAVPIFDINYNNNYAISISATTKKLEFIGHDKIIPEMIKSAQIISRHLGCSDFFRHKPS